MTDQTDPRPADAIDERAAALLAALRKLGGHQGVTFRGRAADAGFGLREGQVVVSSGLVATSRDPRVATENFTTQELYAVVGNAGRALEQLSVHPDEREVVFLPSTMFLVLKRARVDDLPVTIVEQLDPDREPADRGTRSLDETAREVAEAVLGARRRGDVVVHAPGKFVGDLD